MLLRAQGWGWRSEIGVSIPRNGSIIQVGRVELSIPQSKHDTSLSRIHASLRFDSKARCCLVQDLNSRNGVFINGIRIPSSSETQLVVGDCIRFGHFDEFAFVLEEQEEEEEQQTDWKIECEALLHEVNTAKHYAIELEQELHTTRQQLEQQINANKHFALALQESLECPVCFHVKRDLQILKCGHSLCAHCAKEWWEKSSIKLCIVCNARTRTGECVSSFVLDKLVGQIDAQVSMCAEVFPPVHKKPKLVVDLLLDD